MSSGSRPDRDTYFMLMAGAASLRGSCSRLRVGCIVVDARHRAISTGHNGAPPGFPHCLHQDDTPCLLAEHDVVNALVHGLPPADLPRVNGATVYATDSPCMRCATFIHAAGVKRVVYARAYRDTTPLAWLDAKSIIHQQWVCPPEWLPIWTAITSVP